MLRFFVFVLGLMVGSWGVGGVQANDTAMGGTSTDLVPLQSSAVRMVSEDILIRVDGDHWEVSADYVFLNGSQQDVELQVGFPEHRCGPVPGEEDFGDCVAERPLDFESMKTTVDGAAVEHTQGQLDRKHPWAPRLGTVWLYRARFPAGREVRINHRYRVVQGVDSAGAKLGYYVTRTGATWAGSIGRARFRIRVPAHAHELYLPTQGLGLRASTALVEVEGERFGEITLEAEDWTPKRDIDFGYSTFLAPHVELPDFAGAPARAGLPESARCPLFNELWQSGHELANGEHEGDAALIASYRQKGIGDARICRNMLFAVRGRRFKDAGLNRYFYGPDGHRVRGFPFAPFEPSAVFDEKLMSKHDWAAVRLIDAIAQAAATAPPEQPAPGAEDVPDDEPPAVPAVPAAAPTSAPAASGDADAQPASGCGCRNAGGRRGLPGVGWLVVVGALLLWFRRRR